MSQTRDWWAEHRPGPPNPCDCSHGDDGAPGLNPTPDNHGDHHFTCWTCWPPGAEVGLLTIHLWRKRVDRQRLTESTHPAEQSTPTA